MPEFARSNHVDSQPGFCIRGHTQRRESRAGHLPAVTAKHGIADGLWLYWNDYRGHWGSGRLGVFGTRQCGFGDLGYEPVLGNE